MIEADITLEALQEFNKKMYAAVDDRNYNNTDLLSYVLRHITQILKSVRKRKFTDTKYHLCSALSWSLAVANRMHIDLSDEIWQRFPGVCPYCLASLCSCKERRDERQVLSRKPKGRRPESLRDWQEMFGGIYPNNNLQDSAIHLAEEIGELNETIRNYLAVHAKEWFDKIVEELVDVVANLFGVATCLNFNLAVELADYFKNGCPKCRQCPCSCGYVSVDHPV